MLENQVWRASGYGESISFLRDNPLSDGVSFRLVNKLNDKEKLCSITDFAFDALRDYIPSDGSCRRENITKTPRPAGYIHDDKAYTDHHINKIMDVFFSLFGESLDENINTSLLEEGEYLILTEDKVVASFLKPKG